MELDSNLSDTGSWELGCAGGRAGSETRSAGPRAAPGLRAEMSQEGGKWHWVRHLDYGTGSHDFSLLRECRVLCAALGDTALQAQQTGI